MLVFGGAQLFIVRVKVALRGAFIAWKVDGFLGLGWNLMDKNYFRDVFFGEFGSDLVTVFADQMLLNETKSQSGVTKNPHYRVVVEVFVKNTHQNP